MGAVFHNYLMLLSILLEHTTLRGTLTAKATILYKVFTRQSAKRSGDHFDIDAFVLHDMIMCRVRWSPESPLNNRGSLIRDGPVGGRETT